MSLIVEIHNNNINQVGGCPEGCPEGSYHYVVKVNRQILTSGEVNHDRQTHWSLLLKKVAEDGRLREFERVTNK